jgi:hypothetical protein
MNDLERLREAFFTAKVNRYRFTTKGAAQLRRDVWAVPERTLFAAAEMKASEPAVRLSAPAPVLRAMDSSALSWTFRISDETPDLTHDVIKVNGWRLQNFAKNGPVLFCHDSGSMPVGQSSLPYVSGSALYATVNFPAAGISASSDQCRSMIAAGVLRGASVGFVPGTFRLSTDKNRPMGLDFIDGHQLTEWSCCAVPANPNCLVVGPASSSKSAATSSAPASRPTTRAARIEKPVNFGVERMPSGNPFTRAAHRVTPCYLRSRADAGRGLLSALGPHHFW